LEGACYGLLESYCPHVPKEGLRKATENLR
jgi:hypothetical protein